jgi:hypothetical protein
VTDRPGRPEWIAPRSPRRVGEESDARDRAQSDGVSLRILLGLAGLLLLPAAPAGAGDLTSASFVLRSPTISGGGAVDLRSTAPDPAIGSAGATVAPPSVVGVSSGPSGILLRSGVWPVFSAGGALPLDRDGDGILDAGDNCLAVANPSQRDTNRDGYGNACDPDYDDDGVVDLSDLSVFRIGFGRRLGDPGYDPNLDLDGNGAVGISDFSRLRGYFGGASGPSGLACAGTIPCPVP